MNFRVYVDAHTQQMDTTQRAMHGEYSSLDEAVRAARELVDSVLEELSHPGMSADDLLQAFATRGEIPFIVPAEPNAGFDPRRYARVRSEAICSR